MREAKDQALGLVFVPLVLFALLPRAPAQAIGQRTHFVFHVYVDPLHGDDNKALSLAKGGQNPVGNNYQNYPNYLALSRHLYNKGNNNLPKVSPGYLQHAPYAFRTVTGALKYLGQEFGSTKTVLGYQRWTVNLPWKKPIREYPDPELYIDYIVIHCLEGLYGEILQTNSQGEDIDTRSGLPYNGEDFPIYLPDRVCLQGTSALSTIFDARRKETPIILVGEDGGQAGHVTYRDCFIDSLTIRGARASAAKPFPNGAGIHIFRESNVFITISNCFITDNWVGISIDNDEDVTNYRHSPIIVNNTIAWNRVGIWSGDSFQGQNRIGYAYPRVFNNIIDSDDRDNQFGTGQTAPFWGLSLGDLQIQVSGAGSVDFNAYEASYANRTLPTGFLPYWPTTTALNPGTYVPRVDISSYTHAGTTTPRGILYLSDVFRNSQGIDRSPHDFRLAPTVWTSNGPPTTVVLNPLVNMGYMLFSIYFANGAPPITHPPGLPSPGSQGNGSVADLAALHSMDWDCEGLGNPRIAPRPGFPAGSYTDIDIGADEMGTLIMAGFINGTRIFSRNVPNGEVGSQRTTLPITDHTQVYFFNLPGVYPRPFYVRWRGQSYVWWDYVQVPSVMPNPSGRYTRGVANSARLKLTGPPDNWEPFMKGLECDTSPHLLPDMHLYWGFHFTNLSPPLGGTTDPFASNPWYHHPIVKIYYPGYTPIDTDNANLYYWYNTGNPSGSTILLEGTVNPSGSSVWTQNYGYFAAGQQVLVFGPFGYTGSGNYTIPSSPAWGYGDPAPGPDIIPFSMWLGDRYCVQEAAAANDPNKNMQTFLGINDEIPAERGSQKSKLLSLKAPLRPTAAGWQAYRTALGQETLRRIRAYKNFVYHSGSKK